MALQLPPEAQRWLQGHVGVVDVAHLIDAGCSRSQAYRLAASDGFELIMPGVLRSTHWPHGRQQLMMAACLRSPHTSVARTTAALEWKFRGTPRHDPSVHILLPHTVRLELPGVVVQRCRRIDPVDIVHRDDGIRLTSPSRTLFDCADLFGPELTESIFEQLVDLGQGSFVTHAATFSRLGVPGRPGTRTMAQVIGRRTSWQAAVQSELELKVLREIRRLGLPEPELQCWVTLPGGERVRLDFAWPDRRVVLEVDHPFWHAGAQHSHRDKFRDRKLATLGWLTVRVTDLDIARGLAAAIADLAGILALR